MPRRSKFPFLVLLAFISIAACPLGTRANAGGPCDLANSDYAGHRLTFQLFAQAPPYAHLAAVYRNFDWDGPLDFVRKAAGLSERVVGIKSKPAAGAAEAAA